MTPDDQTQGDPLNEAAFAGWFDYNRVHAHTRLGALTPRPDRLESLGWLDSPEFLNASWQIRELGARILVRHFKARDEDPWWPSRWPPALNGGSRYAQARDNQGVAFEAGRDLAREIVLDSRRAGLSVIAYYWHASEATLAHLHPEWVCKDVEGQVASHRVRGDYLDVTGPYGDVVLGRLAELAAAGVDGFYFDDRHLPPDGCWGTALEAAFVEATGSRGPITVDHSDRTYQSWLLFKAEAVSEAFRGWIRRLRLEHPDLVFIVSTSSLAALTSPEVNTSIVDHAFAKTEYESAVRQQFQMGAFNDEIERPASDVRLAAGWALLRDAADGRPPHVWISQARDREELLASLGSVIAWGGIGNIDVREEVLSSLEDLQEGIPRSALMAAFKLDQVLTPAMGNARPMRWAAVHFSENGRNQRLGDYGRAWREVLWPFVGAFQTLIRERVPVGVVTDAQLEAGDLHGYSVLFLPDPGSLTAQQQSNVLAFERLGGQVVENGLSMRWGTASNNARSLAHLRMDLHDHLPHSPIVIEGGPPTLHAVAHVAPPTNHRPLRLVVVVTNDFSWTVDDTAPPPPRVSGVRIRWRPDVHAGLPSSDLEVREILTDRVLDVEDTSDGLIATLGDFETSAVVLIEGSEST